MDLEATSRSNLSQPEVLLWPEESCCKDNGDLHCTRYTLPETNIAPENQWLEDEFPFGMAYFQGLC